MRHTSIMKANKQAAGLRAGKSLPPVEKIRNYSDFRHNRSVWWLTPAKK
jgi:hypothetical protein